MANTKPRLAKKMIGLTLPVVAVQQLDRIATEKMVERAELVRRIVLDYLADRAVDADYRVR